MTQQEAFSKFDEDLKEFVKVLHNSFWSGVFKIASRIDRLINGK